MGRVVAVIEWRHGGALRENARLLERAAAAGRVRPRGWRTRAARWRSLTLYEDGTCELDRATHRVAARRLEG